MESHNKLKTAKTNMAKPRTYSSATNVLAIKEEDIKKKKVDHPKEKSPKKKEKLQLGHPIPTLNSRAKEMLTMGSSFKQS